MKLVRRRDHDSESFALFDALGRGAGYKIGDPADTDTFISQVKGSLDRASGNGILVYGNHAQRMFAYVAASLGKCRLIREEDVGDVYSESSDVSIPDYRVVTTSGQDFFVEVKNCNDVSLSSGVRLTNSYVSQLERYASVFGKPVRIATYWSRWRLWTLVSTEHLPRGGNDRNLTMSKALKTNEMADIGDFTIGTVPPLRLRVTADRAKSVPRVAKSPTETEHLFTIGGVEMHSGDVKIIDPAEQSIAFYLMTHAPWQEREPVPEMEDGKLVAVDFIKEPAQDEIPGEDFAMVAPMSSMISDAYLDLTTEESVVQRLSPNVSPGSLGMLIDPGYRGKHLRLWRFYQQPNYD